MGGISHSIFDNNVNSTRSSACGYVDNFQIPAGLAFNQAQPSQVGYLITFQEFDPVDKHRITSG
jgi:hypothetical protein